MSESSPDELFIDKEEISKVIHRKRRPQKKNKTKGWQQKNNKTMNAKQKPIINAEDYMGFAMTDSDDEVGKADPDLGDDNDCCELKKQLDEANNTIFYLEFQVHEFKRQQKKMNNAVSNAKRAKRLAHDEIKKLKSTVSEHEQKMASVKASFEEKEKAANASLSELQSTLQKLEAEKKVGEEKSYRWNWEADTCEYERYPSAVCDQINQLQVGESMKYHYDEWCATITKLTSDECVQMNDQTKKTREVKRFQISSPIQIKEGKYYTAAKDLDDTDIFKLFYQSVPKRVQIQEIKNVEHQYQKNNYELCLFEKCEESKKTREQVEKYLFHGTDHSTLQFIIKNGFDRSYNKNGVYGKGTYFAKDASYSVNNGYCKRHSDGFHYLLLCKVIVGDSTTGNSNTTKVPLKPNQVEYDSLVDRANNPSIFVVWRDYRALPQYIIKYAA